MEADVVIVGAGSAGSALAFRLAEAGLSVIVVEHGGSDAGPFIQMPGALSYPMNMGRYDWGFRSEPEPHLGGRGWRCRAARWSAGRPRSTAWSMCAAIRATSTTWAEMGATGWGFADVLPYFRRMECWHGEAGDPAGAAPTGRCTSPGAAENPLFDAFVEAGRQAGYRRDADYNGAQQEGFGAMEATIWQGRRWSAASAYLRPALRRPNCTLVRGLARRVVIEDGRATGVEILRGGRVEVIRARAREVSSRPPRSTRPSS
jgi:choline dehydrogenase